MTSTRVKGLVTVGILVVVVALAGALVVQGGGFMHTSNGPYGGVVQAMTIGTDGKIYAALYQGWTFVSSNGGVMWTRSKQGIPNNSRNLDALAACSDGTVYAGSVGGGVFKTVDGGASWTAMNANLGSLYIASLSCDPTTPTTVYAGTSGAGVYRWEAGGPWQAVNNGALSAIVLTLAVTTDGTYYMGRENDGTAYGVYYWNGSTWQPRNSGLPANITVRSLLADGNNLWAGTAGSGVYYWNGSLWTDRSSGLPAGDARAIWILGADSGGEVYAGTEDGFYHWSGSAWEARDGGLEGNARAVRGLAARATVPPTLLAGTDGRGVFLSTSGGVSWDESNEGLSGHVVRAIAINPQYDWRIYAGTFRGGVYWSTNGGQSWDWWSQGLGDQQVETLAVTYPGGDPIYAGLEGLGVYRRDRVDEFNTWTDWLPKSNGLAGSALTVHALLIEPGNSPVVYAGTEDGVYKTLNSGENWARSSTGLNHPITALSINLNDAATLYAGTRQNGVYITTDGGQHWAPLGTLTGDAVRIMALAADNAGTVYAGTADGVYKYSGANWQPDGLQTIEIHTMVVNPITQTIVYAGTAEGDTVGVVEKTELGWNPLNAGLQNYNIYALAIDDYPIQTLHTGTGGSSVTDYTFANTLPEMTPEMGVNLDDGLSIVHLNDLISYTVTYYNSGIVDAHNVVVSMTLPNDTEYVSSDPPFTQVQPNVYWLELPLVELETLGDAEFVVRVAASSPYPETIKGSVSIWDDGTVGDDPFMSNNSDDDIDWLETGEVSLSIVKNAEPEPGTEVQPGSRITYTIEYENLGLMPASQTLLTDTFDPKQDYTIVSAYPTPTYGINVWDLQTLMPNEHGSIEIVVELADVLPSDWPVTNTATLDCAERAPVSSAVVQHTVMNPPTAELVDLTVTGIHWSPVDPKADEPVSFWVDITNQGTADADTSFWVELYIKLHPSDVPAGAWDHDQGYCLNDCATTRPNYVQYVQYLDQGMTFSVPFGGDDVLFPDEGTYDVYAQVDVAFDAPEFNQFWGLYAELDEFNNQWYETAQVGPGGPPHVFLPMIVKRRH